MKPPLRPPKPAEMAAYVDAVTFLRMQAATAASLLRNEGIEDFPLSARIKIADLLDEAAKPSRPLMPSPLSLDAAPVPDVLCREPGCGERVTDDQHALDVVGPYCPTHVLEQQRMAQADRVHDMGD